MAQQPYDGIAKDHRVPATDLEPWVLKVNEILSDPPFDEPQLPCEILPWLLLSSQLACAPGKAETMGITHVMTLNAISPQSSSRLEWAYRSVEIDHTYVASYDEEEYDMIGKHWASDCRPVINEVRSSANEGSRIVVHCAAGQNRSGLIVAATLLELERWPLLKVVRYLKLKRGIVLTNLSFQRQLCKLALDLGLLGDINE